METAVSGAPVCRGLFAVGVLAAGGDTQALRVQEKGRMMERIGKHGDFDFIGDYVVHGSGDQRCKLVICKAVEYGMKMPWS